MNRILWSVLSTLMLWIVAAHPCCIAAEVSPAVTKALQEVDALLTQAEAAGKEADAAAISLILSRAIDPQVNVPALLARVDQLAAEVASTQALRGLSADNIHVAFKTVLYDRHQFAYVPERIQATVAGWNENYRWLSQLMDTGYGTCMSLSTLYFAIAQRNGYDLWPVFVPNHVFIRQRLTPTTGLNIESASNGRVEPDRLYHLGDFFTVGPGSKRVTIRDFTAYAIGCHLGMHFYRAKKFDDALACMEMALKLEPTMPEGLINRGIVLRQLNRHEDAIRDYLHAISLDDGYWPAYSASAYYNIGNIRSSEGKHAEALQHYEKSLIYNSAHVDARMCAWGMRWKQSGKWIDEAMKHFETGNQLASKGQHIDAVAAYQSSIALMPDNHFSHTHLANSLMALKRRGEALAAFEAALLIEPKHPTAIYGKASILHLEGTSEKAIALVLNCLGQEEQNPYYSKLLQILGYMYQEVGQSEKSKEYLEKWKNMEVTRKFLVNPGF